MADEQPKPHVKTYLDERDVKWSDLKANTRKALNDFSRGELKKLDDLGAAFDEDNLSRDLRISAVH
jgi:hypothetical protein